MEKKNRSTVNRKEFIRMFAIEAQCNQREAERFYDAYVQTLKAALKTEKPVLIGDICRMELKTRKETARTNPKTKEKVICPAKPFIRTKLSSVQEKEFAQWLM